MNWTILQNSLALAASVAICALLLGTATAIFAASISARFRSLIIACAAIALALPPFLIANCWMHFFGLNGVWRSIIPFNLYSWPGAGLLMTLLIWPVTFFLVSAALNRIDPARFEIDPLLRGARALRFVILPQIASALAASAVISFVLALNHFSIPALLQMKVFSADVWVTFNTTFDFIEALRLGWPMILGPALLLLCLRGNLELWNGASTASFQQWLGSPIISTLSIIAVIAVGFSVVFPLGHLIANERTWARLAPAFVAGKSAVAASLILALASATIAVIAAILLSNKKWSGAIWLAFLLPGVLLGIAMIRIFNQPALNWVYPSFALVIAALALRYAALPWQAIRHARAAINPAFASAARLEGASRWQTFSRAELPLLAGPLFFAWYIAYLFCLWDAETMLMIVPPGGETLALRIFNMLHYGHTDQVNALCVVLVGLALAPLAIRAIGSRALPLALVAFLAGCSQAPEGAAKVESQLFAYVETWGRRGHGVGEFNKPRSIAVDLEDNVYVADMTGRVQKFSPEGKWLLTWTMPISDKGKPKGMITDPNGGVIVVEPHYARVNHYLADGKVAFQWGINGTNAGQLAFPRSIAVNSAGELFVSEYGLVERIQHFDARGTNLISVIAGDGTKPGEFARAEGIGIDAQDRLFVADSCNHRVQVFAKDGKFLREHGKAGSAPGEMSYPYDVRVDRAGYEFVCEFGNSRVQVFDKDGKHVEFLGGSGLEPGKMNNPWSICLDSKGNLYVADSQNHRVQKFTRREPLASAGGPS